MDQMTDRVNAMTKTCLSKHISPKNTFQGMHSFNLLTYRVMTQSTSQCKMSPHTFMNRHYYSGGVCMFLDIDQNVLIELYLAANILGFQPMGRLTVLICYMWMCVYMGV